jgi:superfamily II DNA or RNA helicase
MSIISVEELHQEIDEAKNQQFDLVIEIQFYSVWCSFFTVLPPELEAIIYSELSFFAENYFFSPKFQNHQWDGQYHLYHPKSKSFRIGLLNRVIDILQRHGCTINVIGKPEPTQFVQRSNTYQLRPYQFLAVQDCLAKRYGILQAPPRAGKTMLVIAITDSERKFPVVFFCRSLDLAYQTVERFKQFLPNVSVGIVGDGKVDIQDVTIITVQSAFSAFGKELKEKDMFDELPLEKKQKILIQILLKKAKIVFYDEVHHVKSNSSKFVLSKCTAAELKIGLSATPFSEKDEDMLVEEAVGDIIHNVTYSELIREGFLLRPTIYFYKLPKFDLDAAYPTIYKQAVVENKFFIGLIDLIVKSLNKKGRSVVIQTDTIYHAKNLHKYLEGSVVLTGKDTTERRQDVIQKIREKKIMCCISTLFEEGIDLPLLDFTINAAGGLSNISTLQRMRSITAVEGKTSCGIIDFYHDVRYLSKHSKRRLQIYESEPEFELIKRDVSKNTIEELARELEE